MSSTPLLLLTIVQPEDTEMSDPIQPQASGSHPRTPSIDPVAWMAAVSKEDLCFLIEQAAAYATEQAIAAATATTAAAAS